MNTLPQFSAPNTGAIRFADIDNESVSVAHDAALSAANFTVEAWVTTTNTDADFNRVVTKAVGGGQTYSIAVQNGEALVLSSVGLISSTGVTVADGDPHHIAGVYDSVAETLSLYVDGALITSISTTGQTLVQGTEDLLIGDYPAPFVESFDGDISDVRIWSDVRTAEEIAETFDQPLSSGADNLELHLRFDGDATDSSGNGRDGVINGAPVFVEGLAPVDPLVFDPLPVDAVEDLTKPITGLRVSDADPGAILTVSLDVAFGVLTLTETIGLNFLAGTNGSASFTIEGTVEDLNAALATLTYLGDPEFDGFDDINLFVDDGVAPVAEPISGAQTVTDVGFFFVVDFDSGLTTAEVRVIGNPPNSAPTNGVHIKIVPNNDNWLAEAVLYVDGATSSLDPNGFALAGYSGGQSINGNSVQFDDSITNGTLTFTNPFTDTPTGPRDIDLTFTGVDFVDGAPAEVDITTATVAISSFTDTSIPITIAAANDAPVAVDDLLTADEDTGLNGDLLADNGGGPDFDVDPVGALSVVEIDGAAVADGETVTLASGAQLTINSDGTFAYDPNGQFEAVAAGQADTDTFTYTITDGETAPAQEITGGLSIPEHAAFIVDFDTGQTSSELNFGASVTPTNGVVITLNPNPNDFEVVAEIYENGVQTFASGDFSLPDYFGASGPAVAGQRFRFEDAFSDLTLTWQRANVPSPTGPRDVSFTFEAVTFADDGVGEATIGNSIVQDNTLATGTAFAFVTINGVNDAPVAQDDMFMGDEDTPITGNLFADNGAGLDADIDSGVFTVSEVDGTAVTNGQAVTTASGATLVIRSDGTFDYDPTAAFDPLAEGEPGVDSFTYTIVDDQGAMATATANFAITGLNDAPIAADDDFSTDEDNVLSGDLLADNFFGPDVDIDNGAILGVTEINGIPVFDGEPVVLASGAILLIRNDGTFDYDPNGAFDGLAEGATAPDSFTYMIADEFGATSIATANVTVFGVNDAPIAFEESFDLDEETSISGDLFADNNSDGIVAFDPEGDAFFVNQINGAAVTNGQVIALPGGGILTIRTDGTFDFDPFGAFEVTASTVVKNETFTYQITDGLGGVSTATAQLQIAGVNDAPEAFDDTFSTVEGDLLAGNLLDDNGLGTDTDVDIDNNGPTSFALTQINGAAVTDGQIITLASGASLTIQTDGAFTYDQQGIFASTSEGETSTDSFTYTIADEAGEVSTATANVTVNGLNGQPIAANDNFAADANAPVSGDILADNGFGPDIDPDAAATLSVNQINGAIVADGTVVELPSGAFLTIRADGTFDYDPNGQFAGLAPGETGTDSFTYQIDDGFGGVSTATADLTILGANVAPAAADDTFILDEGAILEGDLFGDNGGGPDAPVDPGASFFVTEIDGAPVNDGQFVTLASGALLIIRNDGTFIYDQLGAFDQLAQGETADETFTYTIDDGLGGVSTASASLIINGLNNPPVAANDEISALEDTPVSGNLLVDNGFGVDAGDGLLIVEINGAPVFDGQAVALASGANLTIRVDGTFDYDPAGVFEALGATAQAFDDFTYTVADDVGATATASAIVTINGANDAPVALADDFATAANAPVPGDLFADNGFGADLDVDAGDALSISAINGQTTTNGQVVTLPSGALLTIRADGTFDYDPAGAFANLAASATATDTFSYTLSDGQGGTSQATAGFLITGVNAAPDARDDAFSLQANDVITGNFFADNGLGEDTDADNDALSIVQIADLILPQNGEPVTATFGSGAEVTFSSDGVFIYDASAAFVGLSASETATDQFSYLLSDQEGGQSEAFVTFAVTGADVEAANNAPLARDDAFSTDEDTAIGGLFLFGDNGAGADTDEDGDTLSLTSIEGVDVNAGDTVLLTSGAQISVGQGGEVTYDPNAAFEALASAEIATDSFVYQISDGQGGTSDATVRVEIAGASDILFGTAESDILEGTSGADDIRALEGGDFVSGFAGDDILDGGAGADRARGGLGDDSINGGEGNDALFGEGGDDVLAGGDGNDRLRGQRGNDRLLGGDGDDVLAGSRGEDTLLGSDGADTLAGGGDNDRLRGQAGDDKLGGSRGDDMLFGGLGADRIRGGGGDDTLIGGSDDDTLIGGAGDDVFRFAANDGSDIIRRFQQEADLIEIASDGIGFDDLSIVQQGVNVLISFEATELLVTGQARADFGQEDFIFLA